MIDRVLSCNEILARIVRLTVFTAVVAATAIGSARAQAQPRVVTDLPVVHSLVAQVMEGRGEPLLLLDRGADPHAFALRPSQARTLAAADLVVWTGPEMTPWMARAIETLAPKDALQLLSLEGLPLQPYQPQPLFAARASDAEGVHDHPHNARHGHPQGDDHSHAHGNDHRDEHHPTPRADAHERDDHHGHPHGHQRHDDHAHAPSDHGHAHEHTHDGIDPHAWLDPEIARLWVLAIAGKLAAIDPSGAELYQANATDALATITAVADDLQSLLAPVKQAAIVVYHDAYGYFARAFGLTVVGSIALGDAASPSAARLAALSKTLKDKGAVCIFPEVNHSPAFAAELARASGVRLGQALDPAGVTLTPGPDLYTVLLRSLAEAIADCVLNG